MNIESWMITLGIVVGGAISTFAVLRSRSARAESDFNKHLENFKCVR